ncbi:MAG: alpha-glucuronidase [Clostridiaceae bacterium]|nr:alpha-glucuronidase [Clostridiaceae bacterium]
MYEKAWLDYREAEKKPALAGIVHLSSDSPVVMRAVEELELAFKAMYNEDIILRKASQDEIDSIKEGITLKISDDAALGKEGYRITKEEKAVIVEAGAPCGILYGVFRLLAKLRDGSFENLTCESMVPDMPLRMLNHWDNMDGSIERGYSGKSFFFKDNEIIITDRTHFYCRLLASVGINAAVINNVNVKGAATWLIDKKYREPLKELAKIFESYGIRLFLSVNFAAPVELGGLTTADPCNDAVKCWWQEKASELFSQVPNLGGFLIKADSEGRPGPFTYGRTHAHGANMLARILKPYNGLVIWRCFVYNCQQDWRDIKTDRARAAYDNFKPLDGQFDDNVILQIKNGPMDFQVREPVSPLFGALKKTNQMLEVQIAQEYTGQQRHVCYLIPMFKEVLGFRTYCEKENDRVSDIVSGKTYGFTNCGMAAVSNTGDDANWTGHDLAAANLYGFGRLSFDTSLSSEEIAQEWVRLTYGSNPKVIENIVKILMMSWPAYEKYTSPLGIGWMVNPGHHYGPNVDGYEYDRWGTYHRADHFGIGVDRSSKGTGYATLYHEPNASSYDKIETCPEELLLFFHRVKYNHVLSSGKTVIQHIYDTHFEGVEEVEKMIMLWNELKPYIGKRQFEKVMEKMEEQKRSSIEWRDVVNSYFYRKTAIPDEKGRTIY